MWLRADHLSSPSSSTHAWKIPWTEEPGRLLSMGLQRVGHDWVTSISRIGEGNGNPLQYSCLENPVDRGAWWAAADEVAQSRTRLQRLSMLACIGEGNGNPLKYSCLENPRDRGAWWATVQGVAKSQIRLSYWAHLMCKLKTHLHFPSISLESA